MEISVALTTLWSDLRFKEENEWLIRSPNEIDNTKAINKVEISSNPILDIKLNAEIVLEAKVISHEEISTKLIIDVIILPATR